MRPDITANMIPTYAVELSTMTVPNADDLLDSRSLGRRFRECLVSFDALACNAVLAEMRCAGNQA